MRCQTSRFTLAEGAGKLRPPELSCSDLRNLGFRCDGTADMFVALAGGSDRADLTVRSASPPCTDPSVLTAEALVTRAPAVPCRRSVGSSALGGCQAAVLPARSYSHCPGQTAP